MRIVIAFLISFFVAFAASAAQLKTVTVAEAGAGLRLTLTFDGDFTAPESFALDNPKRLVIDLPDSRAGGNSFPGAGAVSGVRTAQFDNHTARVVLDLTEAVKIDGFSASSRMLTIDLQTGSAVNFAQTVSASRMTLAGSPGLKTTQEPARQMEAIATVKVPKASVSKPKTVSPRVKAKDDKPESKPAAVAARTETTRTRRTPSRAVRGGLPVVVVDAGHGGRDPGSPSVNGKHEKDAVLAIAKAIKAELDASGRVRTILTRDDDRYIPHRERTDIARRNNAQLFISVHADSFPQKRAVRGATIYTLSENASDKEAARLARRENRSDVIAGVDLKRETDDVKSILIDLAQRETMNSSAEFAALLQREMVSAGVPFRSHFHRFAGFLVLKAPDVPAVLLETGYMSNAKDSEYLFSKAGQQEVARGVRRAVEAHFLRKLAQR